MDRVKQTESQWLSLIRITCILLLVFHHIFAIPNSGFFPRNSLGLDTLNAANLINAFFHWMGMAAVPLLSIISGYLFFKRPDIHYKQLLLKRTKSVLLPWTLWGLTWLTFAFVLYKVGHQRGLFEWANYGFDTPSIMTVLNGVFGLTKPPFAYQFWFVHDLVLVFLLTPLIGFTLKKVGAWAILPIFLLWVSEVPAFPFFYFNVLFFFLIGSYVALKGKTLFQYTHLPKLATIAISLLFACMLGLRAFHDHIMIIGSYQYLCILRFVGVMSVAIWMSVLLNYTHTPLVKTLLRLSPLSFFIFAVHYPAIEIIKVTVQRIPGQGSQAGLMLSWVLIPCITVLAAFIAAWCMNKLSPKLYSILNGGRSL